MAKEIFDERSQPSGLISPGIFSSQRNEVLLDKIASSKFQTDWGSRGLSSSSAAFDPDSYANGNVFALSTADIAETFWNEHRPAAAFAAWSALVPLTRLDSLGHIHEVRAGRCLPPADRRGATSFEIETPWKSVSIEGWSIHPVAGALYEVDLDRGGTPDAFGYTHRRAVIHFG